MFVTGFVNKQNKPNASMSFNQDINFHRYMNTSTTNGAIGGHSQHREKYRSKQNLYRYSSPQRVLSCPDEVKGHRFKSSSTLSLDSIVTSSETSGESAQCSSCSTDSSPNLNRSVRNGSLKTVPSDNSFSTEPSLDTPNFTENHFQNVSSTSFLTTSTNSSPETRLSQNGHSHKQHRIKRHHYGHRHHHKKSKNAETQCELKQSSKQGANSAKWYQMLLPSYRSRLTQFQGTFLDIPTTEKLVDDFVCALHKEILLQGRLFVAVNYIAFHSNILGYETVVSINYRDVKSIRKATTIKVFPNAIELVTNNDEKYFFTSFISRERAFTTMKSLWLNATTELEEHRLPWSELCKMIRHNYDIGTLDSELADLEHVDLEPNMLKGKNIRKRLKLKTIKSEPIAERNRSGSLTSSYESCPDDDQFDDKEHKQGQSGLSAEDQLDGLPCENTDATNESIGTLLKGKSVHSLKSMINCLSSSITKLLITNESILVFLTLAMVVLVALLQVGVFRWMNSIDKRMDRFQETLETITQLHKLPEYKQTFDRISLLSKYNPCTTPTDNSGSLLAQFCNKFNSS